MKKLMSILMISILFLAGCGSSTTQEIGGSITVGVTGTPTELATYKDLGAKFTEDTGVDVTFKQYTDINTELQAELIGGTAPDVFVIDAYIFPFLASQGVLEPVDESSFDLEEYGENLLDEFRVDGELLAVPKDYSTLAIYYNKEYIQESDIPKSYEELRPFLENLENTLPKGVVPMTFNIDLARQMYLAESTGQKIIDEETGLAQLDQEEIAKNLNLEFDLAKDGLLVTPADLGVGWNGEAFGTGKTAMMLEGNWVAGELDTNYSDIDYGVVENMTANGKQGSMLFSVGWGINVASQNKEAAQEFVKFMSTPESIKESSQRNGVLPARDDVAEEMGLLDDPILGPHIKAKEYATVWQGGNTLPIINTEYTNYAPSIVGEKRTTEDALKETQTQANKQIQENM